MSKHTPGPWAVDDGDAGCVGTGIFAVETGEPIAFLQEPESRPLRPLPLDDDFNKYDGFGEAPPYARQEEHDANARLMAEAPALLNALRDLTELVRDGYQHNDIAMTRALAQAQNAIDKALGDARARLAEKSAAA
jgi:L-alanine-DL-glutamate epimerase-like enolase superfamily enzyme